MILKSIRKIVITGPESSGKTTLAKQLSENLMEAWVPEFARKYLEGKNGVYNEADLKKIAHAQIEEEEKALENAKQILICDTDLITLKVWSEYKYGRCDNFILKTIEVRPYDLYFLCSPEIPWEPDPLREHPEERSTLYQIYKKQLTNYKKNFIELKGLPEERLRQALLNIHSLSF